MWNRRKRKEREKDDDAFYLFLQKQKIALEPYTLPPMKTIPVRSPQIEEEKEDSSLIVGVRINERGPLVGIIIVGSTLTIRMKCLGHEALRGHVQGVYRIAGVPIGISRMTQAGLLENLHWLDTMGVEEVGKKADTSMTSSLGWGRGLC